MPPTPVRRALLPVELLVGLLLLAILALATVVSASMAPFGSRRRPLRISAFGFMYCLIEILTIGRAGLLWLRRPRIGDVRFGSEQSWVAANERLLGWALAGILGAARRCLGFVVGFPGGEDPPALGGVGPTLVLARHAGPGDSFALIHLLMTRYHRRVRIVMKDILQLDPVIDVLFNRLDCCFLPPPRRGEDDRTQRVGRTAGTLGPRETLLLFPEGANWTPKRRHRAVTNLRKGSGRQAARGAVLMTNVLPPRFGGVLACLDARPELQVVIVAHAGLDRVTSMRQGFEALPFRTPMTVRMWPAAKVPDTDADRKAWLTTEWAVVDEWIDLHRVQCVTNLLGGDADGFAE